MTVHIISHINITTFWYSYCPDSHAPASNQMASASALWSMSLVPSVISPAVPTIQLNGEFTKDSSIRPPVRHTGSSNMHKVLFSIFPSKTHSSSWLTTSVISRVILSHPCSKPQPSLISLFSYYCLWKPLKKQNEEQSNPPKSSVGLIAYLYNICTFYPLHHAWMMEFEHQHQTPTDILTHLQFSPPLPPMWTVMGPF